MHIRSQLLWLFVLPCLLLKGSNLPAEKAYPTKYKEIVSNCSRKFNLDHWLVFAIIRTETNFGANEFSHAGAQGLMQIMPLTAVEGVDRKFFPRRWLKNIYNPEVNIYIGSWYLQDLI